MSSELLSMWPTFAMQSAMTARRNRSISTKVTDAEYEQIVAQANPKTVSEWSRAILVNASEPVDIEFLLLAEFLALRTIVLICTLLLPTVARYRQQKP